MGFLDFFTGRSREEEQRGLTTYSISGSPGMIYSTFSTGTPISEEEAMTIPSVVACVELITGSIAQLPIYLYKENDKGEVEKIPNDRRVFLLNNEPNNLLNGYNFKKRLAKDYLFYGVSYTKKEVVRNNVLALNPFDMRNVYVTKYLIDGYKYDADIELTTYGVNGGQMRKVFKPHELIAILRESEDGVTSRGILSEGSEILRLAKEETQYTTNILKNGALPIGVLETANKLSETAIKRLREGWESIYAGSKNSGKTAILEEGIQYKTISIKPNDLQLIDGRKVTVSEITRLFNMPESMINADANKYASNEANNLHFLQYTLSPIITAMEAAFDKSLLLEDEKQQGYYFRFDTTEILRTTERERIEATVQGLKGGVLSLNESRGKIDRPKLEDDFFMWSLGNVLFNPETKEMFVPNMQGSSDLDDGPIPVGQAAAVKADIKDMPTNGKLGEQKKKDKSEEKEEKE